MYYNVNHSLLTQFLEAPRQNTNYDLKSNVNLFNTRLTNVKAKPFISSGCCQRWTTKIISSPYRSVISDQKKRNAFEKHELNNLVFKSLLTHQKQLNTGLVSKVNFANQKVKPSIKIAQHNNKHPEYWSTVVGPRLIFNPIVYKNYLVSYGCFSKIRNRCILTGHKTGLRKFGLSRIMLRKWAGLGKIPGMTKATNR